MNEFSIKCCPGDFFTDQISLGWNHIKSLSASNYFIPSFLPLHSLPYLIALIHMQVSVFINVQDVFSLHLFWKILTMQKRWEDSTYIHPQPGAAS